MPVKVKLKFTKGSLKGEEKCYEQKECVIIGRLPKEDIKDIDNKNIVIPKTDTTVSRYHCMLDITPPSVIVRDFGSLNGTYLNGEKIGQRDTSLSVEEARKQQYNEFPMKSGDRLGLGCDCEIELDIAIPQYCADCFCEIDQQGFTNAEHQPICANCHAKAEERKKKDEKEKLDEIAKIAYDKEKRNNPKCQICGEPIPLDAPAICEKCQKDPIKQIMHLLFRDIKRSGDVQQIAGYKHIRELGRGGMGTVWLVEETKTGEKMAMKLMIQQAAANEQARKMFLREAYNACQLKHPNIVEHYKSGRSGDIYYILMEYCAGGSVVDLMKKHGGKLDIDTATHIILQVLDGLLYSRKVQVVSILADGSEKNVVGIVHRDLKPANIFLSDTSSRPVAKIADFGLAKAFQTAGLTNNTVSGEAAGSPWFMPRQQIIDYRYAKTDVDVWAAAASYYNMLTGFYPKDFSSGQDPFAVALYSNPIPIRERNSKIPEKLAKVIDTALIERPEIGIKTELQLINEIEKAYRSL